MSERKQSQNSRPKSTRTARRRRKSGQEGAAGWIRSHRKALISTAVIITGVLLAAAVYVMKPYSGTTAWVRVPTGSSAEAVGDSLRASLGEAVGDRVYSLWRLMGGSAAAAHGAYRVEPGEWAVKIARRLSRGYQTPVRVSWRDARTMDRLADLVTAGVECSPDEFLAACEAVLPAEGFSEGEFPAAFIPDTYEVYWSTSGTDLVRRLLRYRNNFWNGERHAKAKALGLTPAEAATVASIVEEESAKTDEWPVIARLYLNRVKSGMPLQADPTVKFATGNFALRRITGEHLATESDYNTYRRRGLPPGPIRVASKAGIDAVLAAPAHDYLYMCAREDFSGYHNFARDFATHRANARRYQAELNRRNIR